MRAIEMLLIFASLNKMQKTCPNFVSANIIGKCRKSDDITLLKQYAEGRSEAAFATLVERYVHLVYSTALRQVGNPSHAEEIAQAVFIILTRKAESLGPGTILSGWLYQTARLTAANLLRSEIRRQQREQEAYMESLLNDPTPNVWQQIAPLLDDAMGRLSESDRNAVVLRFFQNKSAAEIGDALGLDASTAQKRITRAVGRLRKFFAGRGMAHSAELIAGAISANSIQTAPVGLAATISEAAVKSSAVAASTLTLVKGALKIMAWTKAKTAFVVAASVFLAAGTTTVVYQHFARPIHIAEMTTFSQQYGLKVGPSVLGWSQRDNSPGVRDGYIMMRNVLPPPGGHNEPLWEFALSPKRRLHDVTRADLRCEFYGMNDPRGQDKFGSDWFVAGIRVPEGQVFFARLISNRSTVYVIRLAKQGGNQDKATMQIEYVTESGFTLDGR